MRVSVHLFVILDGLFEERLHFLRKFTGILMPESADVLALPKEQRFQNSDKEDFSNENPSIDLSFLFGILSGCCS